MISILVYLLILLVVVYVANLVVDRLNLPQEVKLIVNLIMGLIFLVAILNQLGVAIPGLR